MNKAVFYDRDGVVVKLVYQEETGYIEPVKNLNEIKFVPGIAGLLKHTTYLSYKNIIVSNQAGVGLKKISEESFEAVKNAMTERLKIDGAILDGQYYCFHHPDSILEKYKVTCDCRKPKPGMLFMAAKDFDIDMSKSWIIGDSIKDVYAGKSAGCKTILLTNTLESGYLKVIEEKLKGEMPDYMINDLKEAIKIISS